MVEFLSGVFCVLLLHLIARLHRSLRMRDEAPETPRCTGTVCAWADNTRENNPGAISLLAAHGIISEALNAYENSPDAAAVDQIRVVRDLHTTMAMVEHRLAQGLRDSGIPVHSE